MPTATGTETVLMHKFYSNIGHAITLTVLITKTYECAFPNSNSIIPESR